ncbi:MAG: hypothetical protein K6L73_07290 [Cellvibrionaceae bacterium]
MTDYSKQPNGKQQRFEGQLALHASRGAIPPQGPVPSTEELAMLQDDRLSFNRKQEVLSHINADAQLFKQWLDLVEANEIYREQTQTAQAQSTWLARLQQWFTPLRVGAAGIALAGVMSVTLLIPQFDPHSQDMASGIPSQILASHQHKSVTKGLAFGIYNAAKELPLEQQQKLPFTLPAQLPKELLNSNHTLAIAVGYELIAAWQQCQSQSQSQSQNKSTDQASYQPSQALQEQLASVDLTFNHQDFCNELNTYLSNVFTP